MQVSAYHYCVFILIILFFASVGGALSFLAGAGRRSMLPSSYRELFLDLLLGMVGVVVVYSLYAARFVSVNLVFLAVGMFLFIECRKAGSNRTAGQKRKGLSFFKDSGFLFLASVIVFALAAVTLPGKNIGGDAVVYARISHFLNLTGEENEFNVFNLLDPAYRGASPYHYFELWFNAMVTAVFGGKSIYNYMLFFPLVFTFIVYVGLLAIWEELWKVNAFSVLFSLLLLFCGGLLLNFYKDIPFLAEGEYFGYSLILANPKFSVFYPFIIAFMLCFLSGEFNKGLLILLCLPILSMVVLPAVLGGLVLYLFMGMFLMDFKPRTIIKPLLYLFTVSFSIFLFYHFYGNDQLGRASVSNRNIFSILSDLGDTAHLRTRINIIGSTVLRLMVLYSPAIFLVLVFFREIYRANHMNLKPVFLITLSVTGSAILSWALLFEDLGGVQTFFSNSPFINCFYILVGITGISLIAGQRQMKLRRGIFATAAAMLVVPCFLQAVKKHEVVSGTQSARMYSDAYYEEISRAFSNKEIGSLGGSYKSPGDYAVQPFSYINYVYVLGDILSQIDDGLVAVSLSDFNVLADADPLTLKRQKQYVPLGVFYRFVQNQKSVGSYTSIDNSLLAFIKQFNITYIVASKGTKLPEVIMANAKREIVDQFSGERFVILRNLPAGKLKP